MDHATAIRQCLIDLDVVRIRGVWAAIAPHLPQPKTDGDVLIALHSARTAAESVPFKARAYSHSWLLERSLPSQLPDILKPRAQRLYPIEVKSVGIAVRSKYPAIVTAVRGAMEYAVNDCYGLGDDDPKIVRPRMMEARQRELRGLGLLRRGT